MDIISNCMKQICRKLNTLRTEAFDSTAYINKYSYIIFRTIEECKIYVLILYSNGLSHKFDEIAKKKSKKGSTPASPHRELKDYFYRLWTRPLRWPLSTGANWTAKECLPIKIE